ncbi:hypothetical protein I656_03700 [Geobacillus sp. WSUCF1]|nr:hypothetical protein I656_03700 [Geobacillus sp. WSUCF1]
MLSVRECNVMDLKKFPLYSDWTIEWFLLWQHSLLTFSFFLGIVTNSSTVEQNG